MGEILVDLSFSVWLTSLNAMPSRCGHSFQDYGHELLQKHKALGSAIVMTSVNETLMLLSCLVGGPSSTPQLDFLVRNHR